jgi:hypothetical protein
MQLEELLVLAACFICPVMQWFDHWDHELKTGQDTETTFVILALCVGATIAFGQAVVYVHKALRLRTIESSDLFQISFDAFNVIGIVPFFSESPPLATLHI